MIGNLSSYIELFAAIYLTISLDDLLLKRFWTPDYKAKMESSLKGIDMPDVAKEKTVEKAESISSVEETRSRKRGIVLFSFSVLLLVFIGLEEDLSISSKNFESIGLITASLLYCFTFVFDRTCLKTGWRVLVCSVTVPLLVIGLGLILGNIASTTVFMNSESTFWMLFSKIVIILSLILPVLWQLFRNWIYTRYYLLYIVEETTIKAEEYNYAVNFDTKKGYKMNLVGANYQNAVAEKISQNQQDREITPFLNTFMDEMNSIDFLPHLSSLLSYSFLMHKKYYPSSYRLKRLSKRYDSLESLGKKPTLEAFCKSNGVDYLRLREFRKKKES